jgi:hypothetical protein
MFQKNTTIITDLDRGLGKANPRQQTLFSAALDGKTFYFNRVFSRAIMTSPTRRCYLKAYTMIQELQKHVTLYFRAGQPEKGISDTNTPMIRHKPCNLSTW